MFKNDFDKSKINNFGIDGVIIAIAAIAFLASLYALFVDSNTGSKNSKELVAVGRFSKSANDVRRRSNTGFSWSNVRGPDVVYEGDSVFTGDQSTAAIQLNIGSDVKVEPNSLVVIRTLGNTTKFDLQYGSLFGKVAKGQKLLIESHGQQQEIAGDDAEIQIVSNGTAQETKVQVLKGEIKIAKVAKPARTSKAKGPIEPPRVEASRVLKKDDVAKISREGLAEIKKIEVTLTSPPKNSMHWLAPTAPIEFAWTRSDSVANGNVTFELARDAAFTDIALSRSMNANSIRLGTDEKPEGAFYWRVRPDTDQGLPATAWRVSLLPDEPPLPRSPSDGQKLAFNVDKNAKTKEVGKSALFSWEDKTLSKSYDLEVASDEKFGSVVYKKTIQARLSDTSSVLPAGRYFWRVKGNHPDRKNAPWSRLSAFEVSDTARVPGKPEFLLSELSHTLPEKLVAKALRGDVQADSAPAFMWKSVDDVQSYELEVAKDPEFKNSSRRSVKDATVFALPTVGLGSTYVRVRAINENGLASPPSNTARLDVLAPAPINLRTVEPTDAEIAEEVAKNQKHAIDVLWDSKAEVPAYEVEWAADSKFERVTRHIVKEKRLARKVSQPMAYYMRVRSVDLGGKPISEFTAAKNYTYRPERRLQIAKRIQDKAKAEAQAQAQAEAEAAAAIEREKTRQREEAEALAAAAAPPPKPAPKTMSRVDREALSKPFTTHYRTKRRGNELREPASGVQAVPAPRLLEPAPDTSLITLENSKAFVKLSWSPISGAKKYQVQLAPDPDFETILGDTMTTSTRTIFQKRLPEGKVYWRVRQVLSEGTSAWSDSSSINVLYE